MLNKYRQAFLILIGMAIICPYLSAFSYEKWTPETALAKLVCSADIKGIKELIGRGADINEFDSKGRTALMWSGICTSREIAEILLEAGASVNMVDNDGYTALHYACIRTSEHRPPCKTCTILDSELVKMLIEAGSDVNAGEADKGFTPLYKALWPENLSIEIVEVLLNAGADPNIVFSDSWAPVNVVAQASGYDFYPAIELFEILIEAGADPNHLHYIHGTPIIQAVKSGNFDFISYLIDLRVDLNIIAFRYDDDIKSEYTALDLAIKIASNEIVRMLKDAGAKSAFTVKIDSFFR